MHAAGLPQRDTDQRLLGGPGALFAAGSPVHQAETLTLGLRPILPTCITLLPKPNGKASRRSFWDTFAAGEKRSKEIILSLAHTYGFDKNNNNIFTWWNYWDKLWFICQLIYWYDATTIQIYLRTLKLTGDIFYNAWSRLRAWMCWGQNIMFLYCSFLS